MTACREQVEQLEAMFAGDLPEKEADQLRAHLAGCEGCRAYHDRLWQVEAALERRAMPSRAVADLERRLLAQLQTKVPWTERLRRSWAEQPWLRLGAPLAAAAAVVMLVVFLPQRPGRDAGEFRPRAGGTGPAFGVRAHCIGSAAQVTGEARPGEQLSCPEGSAIQLSVTAPEAALLTATALTPGGETHALAKRVPVAAGTDVPLPFSTPSQRSWLSGPTRLTVRFESEGGEVLAERELTLSP